MSSDNASSKQGETERSQKDGPPVEGNSKEIEQKNAELKKEIAALRKQALQQKREYEIEMVNVKTQQKEELKKL